MNRRLARSGLALAALVLATAAAAEEVHLYAAASLTDAVTELAVYRRLGFLVLAER